MKIEPPGMELKPENSVPGGFRCNYLLYKKLSGQDSFFEMRIN